MRRFLLALLAPSALLCAQQAQPPSLPQILDRLEANLHHYDARVPSFFCEEHLVSSQTETGRRDQQTVVDSIFRIRRTPAGHGTRLVESREIQTVDGKPPAAHDLDGPAMLSGIFEGGLAVVSRNQTPCMAYTLLPRPKSRPRKQRLDTPQPDSAVIRFSTYLTPQNTAACFLQEKSRGRVILDPSATRVTRLEISTPHHAISDPGEARIFARRELAVDYAPVLLSGETFWMPAAISMHTTRGAGSFHVTDWSFQATYHNCHRLEVTTRILPGSETPAP